MMFTSFRVLLFTPPIMHKVLHMAILSHFGYPNNILGSQPANQTITALIGAS